MSLRIPKNCVGMYTSLEFAFEFNAWASALRTPPSATQIAAQFGVCRATAYRYRAAYNAFLAKHPASTS